MAPVHPMFSGLRNTNRKKTKKKSEDSDTKNNDINKKSNSRPNVLNSTTHANTITLNSGNLFVGKASNNFNIHNNTLKIDRYNNANEKTNIIKTNANTANTSTVTTTTNNNNRFKGRTKLIDLDTNEFDNDQLLKKGKNFQLEIMYHESRISNEVILLNLGKINGISEGDLCELKTYNKNKQKLNSQNKKKIYFIAKDFNDELKRRSKNSKISIMLGQLQSLLDLPARSKIWVKIKNKSLLESDVIEINIKDCSLNRGDMWALSSRLADTCVFNDQRLTFFNSIRGTVKGVYRDGKKLLSGYIGDNTKIIFRSESARLIFFIQITEEMWHFDETGEQLFQKMINSYFPKIFKKWKDIDTHHSITIAFAISMDLSDIPHRNLKPGERLKNPGDNYRIVVDQVSIIHWVEIMETLSKEFVNLRRDLLNVKTEKGFTVIRRKFAPVIKSNFLEMINFATLVLADPFKQVDLRHTTTHVMIISPGTGLYDVDYDLLNLTGRKLLSLEMTMDLICLSRAPLHVVPLFRYLDYEKKLKHCIPKWLSIFFWNDSTKSIGEWHPRCQIYDLQMMGLTDNEVVKQAEIEHLDPSKFVKSISLLMENFDQAIFLSPDTASTKQEQISNIHKTSNEYGKNTKTSQLSNNLVWQAPTFAEPIVEEAQKLDVTADIAINNNTETPEDTKNISTVEINQPNATCNTESLAINTLKDLTKKKSVKDFTRSLFTRFAQTANQQNIISNETIKTSPGPELQKSNNDPKTDNNDISNVKESFDNNLIIKKNLAIFRPHNIEDSSGSHLESNSFRESMVTGNSSNFSHSLNLPGLNHEEPKLKIENQFHIFNETWIEINNPSVPVGSDIVDRLLPVRWKDVWPKYVAKKYSKWRSFSTPAELPITISDFPSRRDFEANFFFRNHSVTLNIDQESYNQTATDLLRNMIYVRLVAGFQICVGKQVEEVERSIDKDMPIVSKYIENKNWDTLKVYMMIDSEIHRITCSLNGIIDVQRYLRKEEVNPFDQVPIHIPLIKTRYEHSFRDAMIDPIHTHRESLNWNQIDQVVAGYGDFVMEKKWHSFRAKFVLLPADIPPNTFSIVINGKNETLTPEELRLEGLRRVIASIAKSRLRSTQQKQDEKSKTEEIQPEVIFYTGSLFNFISEQRDSLDRSVFDYRNSLFVKGAKPLAKNIDLHRLAYEIQQGSKKLTLINRKWHWKNHENCFIGSEMVNWLISNFLDIKTRDDAIAYGQDLMSKGLFIHVLNKHNFLDGHYFYQLASEYINDKPIENTNSNASNGPSEILRKSSTHSTTDTNTTPLSRIVSNSNSFNSRDDQTAQTKSVNADKKPTVKLSNSVIIDIDPLKKSYRQETCTVHYDRVHNPDHCFHLRLEWLASTPVLLDDLIGNWSRICEKYGLKLIEIPWQELCTIPTTNPFHSFVEISLAINPWMDPEFNDIGILTKSKFFYHINLLKQCGFMLDNRASTFLQEGEADFEIKYSWGIPEFKYAQYIHRTGAYIAEIRESGDLFLAPNNIYITRIIQSNANGKIHHQQKPPINSQEIMESFRNTCTNHESLRALFSSIKEEWLAHSSDEDH